MNLHELETAVQAFVNRPNYRPLKPKAIAKKLGLSEDDGRKLKKAIKKLVKLGQLAYGSNHLVQQVGDKSQPVEENQLSGIFRRAGGGFGFVRPRVTGAGYERQNDVYIAAKYTGDAANGDLVLVRLFNRKAHGRPNPEGRVVEVIERDTHHFVGTYFERLGRGYVDVDGGVFSQSISVGDPGAKNARPDDKVVIELIRFPSHLDAGEGVLTEVLGARGTPGVDTLTVIRQFGFPEVFAEDALEQARAVAAEFDDTRVPEDRLDLTGETVITIDPVDARDFDDAISLERLDGGNWRLGVHIADVSHFVREHTPLDREAYQRTTSVYLPDRVLPMLPELVSNGVASLQPDRLRFTKSVFIEFTADGAHVATDWHRAAIKSVRRFAYEEVDDFLEQPAAWTSRLTPAVFSLLERMRDLSRMLRARRRRRGALELSLPEVKIDLDQDGQVSGAHVVVNTESHRIIEEFMLSANEAVAERLVEAGVAFLRRAHLAPDPRKLKDLTLFVRELGIEVESLESRFELQNLIDTVANQPEARAVNYAVLRSLQRATYRPDEEGHFALASNCYCHFTSPIRRYPDLTIHRLLDALIVGKAPVNDFGQLVVVGEHCSTGERAAEEAERELTKIKLLTHLSDRIGEELSGVVTGVEPFGLFVQGVEMPAEGLVHIDSLTDDYYRFDRSAHTLTGHREGNSYRLGDHLRVRVARVDIDRRELDFRLVSKEQRRPAAKVKSTPARRPRQDRSPPAGKKKSTSKRKSSGKAQPSTKATRKKTTTPRKRKR